MSDFKQYTDEQGIACERVKSPIQESIHQRARHYQIYSLSIFFEGDQTGAAEDSKIFLDMVRCLGAEGDTLRIPQSSPRLGGPGWVVNGRIRALIQNGLQLDPEYGRVLLILHYAGHGAIGENGLMFNGDSQYPRSFNYDRTINPKLETISNYLGESLDIFDCVTILDCCHSGYATRENNVQTRCAEVLPAVREDQYAFPKDIDSAGKVTARTFTAKLSALVSQWRGKGTSPLVFLMLLKSWECIPIELACHSSRCYLDPRPQSAFPSSHHPLL